MRVNDLNEALALTDNDYFLIDGADGTKKISVANLKNEIEPDSPTTTLYDINDEPILYLAQDNLEPYIYAYELDIFRAVINTDIIPAYTFLNAYNLTTVDLPNATRISPSAFYNCYNLTTVDLPNATSIGAYAFRHCTELTTVNLPNATGISQRAFYYCTGLKNIYLICDASKIGDESFYRTSGLTMHVHPDVYSTYTSTELDRLWCPDATIVEWIQD